MIDNRPLVALIACCKRKLDQETRAERLYQGTLFKASLAYARHIRADHILILSAKYGAIHLDEIIQPYDLSLTTMTVHQRRQWAQLAIARINARLRLSAGSSDPLSFRWLILAGKLYRDPLLPHLGPLATLQIPLAGLPIGKQVAWLQSQTPTPSHS
jgi:hypothetical protein